MKTDFSKIESKLPTADEMNVMVFRFLSVLLHEAAKESDNE